MILATLIKDHREKRGFSLRQMAKKIGVDYDALWRFEKGRPLQMRHWVVLMRWLFKS